MTLEERRAYDRARYHANPEKRSARQWKAANAERNRARDRLWRLANREKERERLRRWKAANLDKVHAERASRRGATRTEKIDPVTIYNRDNGRCHICRRQVSAARFHLDHLVPLSRGGTHTEDNVSIAHPRCNLRRGPGRLPAQLRLI